jgi:thioredoxin reductase (NADPH)
MNYADVAIIGCGPAGMMAALQLRRFGLTPLLFEARQVGGLLLNANRVENYPGFPEGISGPKLVDLFERQLMGTGVNVIIEEIRELDYDGTTFLIQSNLNSYQSRIIVVASGTKPVLFPPGIISHDACPRVSYDVRSLSGVENCNIAIVGAGDAAFDYAFSLSRNNTVQILNRQTTVKCLPLLWNRLSEAKQINYRAEIEVISVISGENGNLLLKCTCPDGKLVLEADYLIGALGRVPKLDYFSPCTAEKISEFERRGILYQVGDVKNGRYRQTAIAIGDGLMAAMKIYQLLEVL